MILLGSSLPVFRGLRRHTGLNPGAIVKAVQSVSLTRLALVIFIAMRSRISTNLVAHAHTRFILEALVQSFLLVFVGEMGDKTQLLALVLAAKFRKPWTVMAGIFAATLINHGLSAWAGGLLSAFLTPEALRWSLAAAFFGFAAWVLIPDKDEGYTERGHWGAFLSTTVAFFIAEMGDKTQLATVALGAMFSNIWIVTIGTTLGMLAANSLAVFCGHKLLDRIPLKWVRIFACALFVISGFIVLFGI